MEGEATESAEPAEGVEGAEGAEVEEEPSCVHLHSERPPPR